MTTVFIVRRDAQRCRQTQALIEASRGLHVLGVAESLFRARAALPTLDPDTLLIDLRLEDGAALSLVREFRERRAERPKVMLLAAAADDPLLFSTLAAGADAYLLEADLAHAAASLVRLQAGEATMAADIARQTLAFFREALPSPAGLAGNDRGLDWHTDAGNPMRVSPGERRLLQLLAHGTRSAEIAARMALSVEAIGRRTGNLFRKLSWDVRSGSLSLQAA